LKRLAVILLLCSCGRRSPESAPQSYARVLATFRNSTLVEAWDQARIASKQCGSDLRCQWQFRLLEAEILANMRKLSEAVALLSQSVPDGPDFAALELRRRVLLGYYLSSSKDEAKTAAGRQLLDGAYRAAQLGRRELLPEIEIMEGRRARDPAQARALFLEAQQHAIELHDRFNQSAALNNLGMMAVSRSRFDEAIPFFEQALAPARQVDARLNVTAAYTNLALCYTQLGDYDRALKLQNEALTWLGKGDSPVVRPSLFGEMGRTLELKGDPAKAIDYYRQAIALLRNLPDGSRDDIRRLTSNLASALCATGDWDAADQANREETALARDDGPRAYATLNAANIALGRKQFDDAAALYQKAVSFNADVPSISWDSDDGLAKAYAAEGNQTLARSYFEKGIQAVDRSQTELSSNENKLTFLASLIRFYRDYVEFLMQNGDSIKALEVVESSRARILAETTADRNAARQFSTAELRVAAARSARVFLSYWLAPVQSYVWAISASRIDHFALGPSAGIEALVDTSRQTLHHWDLAAKESPEAGRLYDAVLRKVAPSIPPGARVVIVPDGALHYLNFETLPVPGDKPRYWIEDATVAVAPSLAIAMAAPTSKPIDHKSLLIMGDALPYADYPKLDYAPVEVARISSHFASTVKLTEAGATPAAYRQADPQRFSVIHFSAHGEPNSQSPLDSAIILSPKDGAFKLYARDVIDVPLHADLVTISACRSAGARVYSGEGLVGFAWAFLKAGAHYVVAGLWDVTDSSTPDMMDEFYAAIQAGKSPPDALRMAKLSMIHSGKPIRKPYYWGPFQIYIR